METLYKASSQGTRDNTTKASQKLLEDLQAQGDQKLSQDPHEKPQPQMIQ